MMVGQKLTWFWSITTGSWPLYSSRVRRSRKATATICLHVPRNGHVHFEV